jgi:hypothetical protein
VTMCNLQNKRKMFKVETEMKNGEYKSLRLVGYYFMLIWSYGRKKTRKDEINTLAVCPQGVRKFVRSSSVACFMCSHSRSCIDMAVLRVFCGLVFIKFVFFGPKFILTLQLNHCNPCRY